MNKITQFNLGIDYGNITANTFTSSNSTKYYLIYQNPFVALYDMGLPKFARVRLVPFFGKMYYEDKNINYTLDMFQHYKQSLKHIISLYSMQNSIVFNTDKDNYISFQYKLNTLGCIPFLISCIEINNMVLGLHRLNPNCMGLYTNDITCGQRLEDVNYMIGINNIVSNAMEKQMILNMFGLTNKFSIGDSVRINGSSVHEPTKLHKFNKVSKVKDIVPHFSSDINVYVLEDDDGCYYPDNLIYTYQETF